MYLYMHTMAIIQLHLRLYIHDLIACCLLPLLAAPVIGPFVKEKFDEAWMCALERDASGKGIYHVDFLRSLLITTPIRRTTANTRKEPTMPEIDVPGSIAGQFSSCFSASARSNAPSGFLKP